MEKQLLPGTSLVDHDLVMVSLTKQKLQAVDAKSLSSDPPCERKLPTGLRHPRG